MHRLRSMNEKDLDLVLEWRNRPEIRDNMYTTHVISKEEHYKYFENVWHDETKKYLIYEDEEGHPLGVVNFVNINVEHGTAFWAFYSGFLEKRGIGKWMEYLALNYAFETLQLNKLSCEVLDSNYKVIRLHRSFGFDIEGIFRAHHYTKGKFVDVYRLAMFRKEWLKYLKHFFTKQLYEEISESSFRIGQAYEEAIEFTPDDILKFAEISKDNNPIHLADYIAKKNGFKGVICHGMLIGSAFSRIIGTKMPGNGTIYLKQSLEFLQPVYPNCPLKIKFKVISMIDRKVALDTTLVDKNENLLVKGEALVLLPKEPERSEEYD